MLKKSHKLAAMLSLPALDGNIIILAASGMLKMSIAPLLAVSYISGPASLLMASSQQGTLHERISTTFVACLIATILIVSAAALGSRLESYANMRVLKITGAVILLMIASTMLGFRIPEKMTYIMLGIGVIASLLIRN
ncbi:hypothetical protein H6503_00055 [Candidatus Woesearchaeota archaeon]|nr:hypothetical protein [Candidatus Woesearchaeota archaeon]